LRQRCEGVADLSVRYAIALASAVTDPAAVDGELYGMQGVNGILFDLRDYNTKLREMQRTLWLDENLPSWLPNMLQPYDRASDMCQREITQLERIKRDYRRGIPLPPAATLGLISDKPSEPGR
jgi:hypothetical protein